MTFSVLFKDEVYRYKINAFCFTKMRENLNLSVKQFSAIVGWTTSYQYKLESGKVDTVSKKTIDEIITAFTRCGLILQKTIWGIPQTYYKVNGSLIKALRIKAKISLKKFSKEMGWSYQYQQQIEAGKIKLLHSLEAKDMSNLIQLKGII